MKKYYTVIELRIKYRRILERIPKKEICATAQKQVTMIPRNQEKVAQEVTLKKLMFLRKVLSQLTVEKFYLTA